MVCIGNSFFSYFLSSLRISYYVFYHIHPFPQFLPDTFPFPYLHNFFFFLNPSSPVCAAHIILELWSSIDRSVVDLPGAILQSLCFSFFLPPSSHFLFSYLSLLFPFSFNLSSSYQLPTVSQLRLWFCAHIHSSYLEYAKISCILYPTLWVHWVSDPAVS